MKLSLTQFGQRLSILAAFFMTTACQTTAASTPVPAVLVSTDTATMDKLKSTLSKALGQKTIMFGATDWTSSTVSVLPQRGQSPSGAPFNQQDFAIPKQFDLMMDSGGCYLQQKGTDTTIPLENIACIAV